MFCCFGVCGFCGCLTKLVSFGLVGILEFEFYGFVLGCGIIIGLLFIIGFVNGWFACLSACLLWGCMSLRCSLGLV